VIHELTIPEYSLRAMIDAMVDAFFTRLGYQPPQGDERIAYRKAMFAAWMAGQAWEQDHG
jgi:hypothetical protein